MNKIVEYVNELSATDITIQAKRIVTHAHAEVPGMKDIRMYLDSTKVSVSERASMVYSQKKDHPKITITQLCFDFGISETYYRTEKTRYGKMWEGHYNDVNIKDSVFFAYDYAADKNIEDWVKQYNTLPMELFLIPKQESSEPTPQQATLVR